MSTCKGLPTHYAGLVFRSRLEAQWAVFFDKTNTKWEWEPEVFRLPPGEYRPDFWLPDLECYWEVKGEIDKASLAMCSHLAVKTNKHVVMSVGAPWCKPCFLRVNGPRSFWMPPNCMCNLCGVGWFQNHLYIREGAKWDSGLDGIIMEVGEFQFDPPPAGGNGIAEMIAERVVNIANSNLEYHGVPHRTELNAERMVSIRQYLTKLSSDELLQAAESLDHYMERDGVCQDHPIAPWKYFFKILENKIAARQET